MNEYRNDPAAQAAASELAEMVSSVLSPTELRLFMCEAFRVAKALLEAAQQQALLRQLREQPSMN
jgi:hypothetical protein